MAQTLSRRTFVASAAVLPAAFRALASAPAAPRWVLLGTDKGVGISRCAWDAAAGRLGPAELAIKAERPDFFAMHPRLPRMYSVNSSSGAHAGVSSFRVDAAAGGLEFAEWQSSLGAGPCFVSVDATGRSAFAANYPGGSFAAFPLAADGALKAATGSLDCRHNPACGTEGPVKDRQEAPHLHCATISPDNDFVLACDLGNDSLEVFPIFPGRPDPLGVAQRFAARAGSGPRHVAFHPNRRWLYVIHELDCTVELWDWTARDGRASLRRRDGTAVSTIGRGEKREGATACEVLVSPDGRFVYTCTRGTDMLVTYSVDRATGALREMQRLACGGRVPRLIAFDPERRFLLCSNQVGSTVTVFAHEARTGRLTGPVQTLEADTPMFTLFV